MGSLYQRGQIWWMKYHRGSKTFRQSTRTKDERKAQKLLDLRMAQVKTNTLPSQYLERIRFDELAKDYLNDYRINARKTFRDADLAVRKLKEHFAGMRVMDLSTDSIQAYILIRQNAKLSNATINRQLSALKRMFTLGARATPPKVPRIPYIPMLKELNVRRGFFEHDEFLSLRGALPDYLKPIVSIAYHCGFRKGEILGLTWKQVDLERRRLILEAGTTKNNEGRIAYMTEDLFRVLAAWKQVRDWKAPNYPHVCFRPLKKYPEPVHIGEFRKAWDAACEKIGLEGRLFHDFRRTAVRNMVRAGIPELVAMRISGHKTRSVFDRYNITSESDLKDAAGKLDAFHGHNLGTIGGLKGNEGQQAITEQTENSEEKSWAHQDSNLGPADYESAALTV